MTRNRYLDRYEQLKKEGRKIFMPFTVLGWPSRSACLDTIKCMIDAGASALELGVAFSDPVADGPVIQKATHEVLESGFKTADALALVKDVRALNNSIPIGLLVYYNVVLAFGLEKFFQVASESGVDGVLIADLPVESAHEVQPVATKYGVNLIFIVSPVTSAERLPAILEHASGFIYLVARLGVTGSDHQAESSKELSELLAQVKKQSKVPVCAGFGIGDAASARVMLDAGADGVIVGSKIVELVQADPTLSKLRTQLGPIADACKEAAAGV